jgi:glycosyltransferase involved in cell wall biosynthesis
MSKRISKVSVYILAYNEEAKIEDCINSVTWANEVVLIDSHSTDKTAEIAENLGTKVVQVDFEGFGKIRMAGIEHTTNEWILSVDADERFTTDAREEVERVITSKNPKDAYFVPRRNTFMGKKIRFCGWFPNYRQPQLFRRGKMTYEAKDLVHEDFSVSGEIGHLRKPIIQIPFLHFSEILQKMDRYSELGAAKLIDKKKKCPTKANIVIRSIWTFLRIYIFRLGILDGWAGFVIAFSNMEGTFYRYAKLKELMRKNLDNGGG